jgi:hypothetical protein
MCRVVLEPISVFQSYTGYRYLLPADFDLCRRRGQDIISDRLPRGTEVEGHALERRTATPLTWHGNRCLDTLLPNSSLAGDGARVHCSAWALRP